jgi:predicted small lipoprotein YifL
MQAMSKMVVLLTTATLLAACGGPNPPAVTKVR